MDLPVEKWPISELWPSPSGEKVLRVFSRSGRPDVPFSEEAECAWAAWETERRAPVVGDHVVHIQGEVLAKSAIPLLALLFSESERIERDPCDRIEIRVKDPENNPQDADKIVEGKRYPLTGLYGPTERGLALVLLVEPDGELVFQPGMDGIADYPRTLLHELGHGATWFAPETHPRLFKMVEELVRKDPIAGAQAILDRARHYDDVEQPREITADLWMARETMPDLWLAISRESTEIASELEETCRRSDDRRKEIRALAAEKAVDRARRAGPSFEI